MARSLRPLVLAGYAGALAALLGAELGGPEWMLGGFMLTLLLAFLLYGIAETRQTATVTMSSTVLGVAWIALGLGHLLLLRDFPEHGRLAVFTVLLAVFADDTAAYLIGRLLGRHKLAPSLSPGKTWEGFVAGTARGDRGRLLRALRAGLPLDPGVDRARRRGRARRSRRRPLRVGAQARPAGEGLGPAARRPRRHARPDRLAALRLGRGLLRGHRLGVGHTVPVKRIALLGATGSIGRQAIEVIERNPELELCALASGTSDLTELAREHGVAHTQAGGDVTELLERARARRRPERDRRLRRRRRDAVGARARRHARAREQGEPRRGRRARARGAGAGRRPAAAGRLRALRALPVPRGPSTGFGRLARADRLGRAVPRPHAATTSQDVTRRGCARASDLEHGPEDHGRLGDARQQGARADRGALPLRPPVRPDRGRRSTRPRSSTRSSASATARRSRTSAIRT